MPYDDREPTDTLCLLPDESWQIITGLTPADQRPERATFGAALASLIRTGRFGLIILDPLAVRPDLYEAALTAAHGIGSIVCVLTSLTAISASRILESADCVPTEVALRDARTTRRLIQRVLRAGHELSASAWLLRMLSPRIARLDLPLRTAIVGMFGGLEVPRTVQDLADAVGLGRRGVERAAAGAGLRSVKRLLDVVRVARAWDVMTAPHRSLHAVSDAAGFASVRTLVANFDFFVEEPPRRARKAISARDFARRLIFRLLNGDAPERPPKARRAAVKRQLVLPWSPRPVDGCRDSALDDADQRDEA